MTNTINTQKANENNFPTNGNCKKVKDLTTGKEYGSITETAITIGVTQGAVSYAIKNGGWCKGHHIMLLTDLHDNIEVICEESAKANARAAKETARANKAEAKVAELESEMAEYRKWKVEQEAKRKAEEKARKEEEERLERERKEEEKRQAKITKLEDKIERLETLIDRKDDERRKLVDKRNKALNELKALNDGKEVA